MTITLNSDARRIASFHRPVHIILKVTAGTVQIAPTQQDLIADDGLPLIAGDGVVAVTWEHPELWAAGDSTPAVLRVIVP